MARILIVDDNSTIRSQLSRAFVARRHEPFEAATGEEAIEVGRTTRPAGIVVDLVLPGIGGLGVLAALRTEIAGLVGIAISGVFDRGTGTRAARSAGAVEFMSKPFRMDHLVDVLERNLTHPPTHPPTHPAHA